MSSDSNQMCHIGDARVPNITDQAKVEARPATGARVAAPAQLNGAQAGVAELGGSLGRASTQAALRDAPPNWGLNAKTAISYRVFGGL